MGRNCSSIGLRTTFLIAGVGVAMVVLVPLIAFPLAVGLAKLIVDQGDGLPKHAQMAIERWAQSQLITTGDVSEAMHAFLEKRPAKFRGN